MDIAHQSVGLGFLQFLSGEHVGGIFPINKPTIMIGREPHNDIVISDPTVSRLHAQLTYKGTYWAIEKLSLTNSLFVNSRDVYTAIVNNHDTISMGEETSFLFIISSALQNPTFPYPNPQPYQQNIYCENFIYYGREHRSMYVAPNIVESACDEDGEDEEEWEMLEHGQFPCSRLSKSGVSRKLRNRIVLVHGSIGRFVHKPSR